MATVDCCRRAADADRLCITLQSAVRHSRSVVQHFYTATTNALRLFIFYGVNCLPLVCSFIARHAICRMSRLCYEHDVRPSVCPSVCL